MKTTLKTLSFAAALSIGSLTVAQTTSEDSVPNLILKGENTSVLNAQNLGKTSYTLAIPGEGATQVRMKMKGYVFGIRVIKADVITAFNGTNYTGYTDAKSSGLAALLKKMEIWSVTQGRYDKTGLRPDWHVQQNTDKKNRRVEMNYNRNAATVNIAIVPPLGSQGTPPATPRERYSANDTISGILHLMMMGTEINGELCTGKVPFFDSKQHYNLRLQRVGTKRVKFDGKKKDTIHCRAYYEPISGYDSEDLPSEEEASTPVNVYFKYYPEVGVHVPVRFTYKIKGFTAVVKVSDLELISRQTN